MNVRGPLAIGLLVGVALAPLPAWARAQTGNGAAALLGEHSRRVDEIRHTAEALLGPMPAVASTPFFGLAALAAAGMAAKTDLVRGSTHPWVRAFRDSALIREAQRYASWPVLLTLVGLALVAYVANSGKVRGVGGKLLRVVEDSSSVLVYFALSLGALEAAAPRAPAAAVIHLGILDATAQGLVALGLALGLGAMMISRYACDVMVWLIPVPFIDFAFETAKKLLTVGFLCLYLFAPAAAAAVALVLLAAALLVAPWALRILGFTFHILLRPLLGRLLPALRPRLLDPHLVAHHAPERAARLAAAQALAEPGAPDGGEPAAVAGFVVAADAVALALPGVPRRARGVLFATAQGAFFARTSPFGRRRAWPLGAPAVPGAAPPGLTRALLWIELRAATAAPASAAVREGAGAAGPGARIALPRTLDLTRLGQLLGAAGAADAAGGVAAQGGPPGLARPQAAGLASPP